MNTKTLSDKAIALIGGAKISAIVSNTLSLDNGINIIIDSPELNEVTILNRTAENLPPVCFIKTEDTEATPNLFPNGFDSWRESHFEISAALNADGAKAKPAPLVSHWQLQGNHSVNCIFPGR